jgi:hypothetical protein
MSLRYAAIFAIVLASNAFSQCAPVDCLSQLPAWGGLCSATFIDGRVGEPYSDAISFHVTNECTPATLFDPTLTGVSIRITQITSVAFTQLPSGLTGTTNQASYTPPANGCGALVGVPTEAGVFEASVDLVVNVNAWPLSLTCGGFGPIAQNGNDVGFPTLITILPDPSFNAPAQAICLDGAAFDLVATGTQGGTFSGPGVTGGVFDPALAGVGTHSVKYVVSAQDGAAIAAATDSLSIDIVVEDCSGGCDAFAGTLGGVDFIPCLEPGGSVELIGIPGGDAVVPDGYEVLYVLTQGAGLTIIDAGPDPVFNATATGLHTIHTLVYDPATLDLSIIEFGVTTGVDVNGLLIQGGGVVCASLDVVGVAYVVEACVDPCDADAGTLSGGGTVCFEQGEAELVAVPNADANVPDGFEVVYVLTEGAGLVLADAGAAPSFTVNAEGGYTIHTLVYDPATLDLSIIEFGVTTGFDVNGLLIQGGGDVCASLDVQGANYTVEICSGLVNAGSTNLIIAPNPNPGLFWISGLGAGVAHLEVHDMSGRRVHAQSLTIPFGMGGTSVALSGLAPGTYALRLTCDGERHEQRLVIQP